MSTAAKTSLDGEAEEHEGADHPGVDRPHAPRASGIRLATMPTKKPWMTTPSGTDAEGVKAGPEDPDCAAQKPIAPTIARPPCDGLRIEAERLARAARERRRHGRQPARDAPRPALPATPGEAALEVARDQREQQEDDEITPPAIAAGTTVRPAGAGPVEDAGAQQDRR